MYFFVFVITRRLYSLLRNNIMHWQGRKYYIKHWHIDIYAVMYWLVCSVHDHAWILGRGRGSWTTSWICKLIHIQLITKRPCPMPYPLPLKILRPITLFARIQMHVTQFKSTCRDTSLFSCTGQFWNHEGGKFKNIGLESPRKTKLSQGPLNWIRAHLDSYNYSF